MNRFVHLHAASAFSAHYGTGWPEDLVRAAAADGAEALACTERDGLYGAVKHVRACLDHGMAPILGTSLPVSWESRRSTSSAADQKTSDGGRVLLLAHGSTAGYASLCRAVSAAHRRRGGPILEVEELAGLIRSSGEDPTLYVLLGPESDLGAVTARRGYAQARALLRHWRSSLPAEALRVELVSHMAPPGDPLSTAHAARMLAVADSCGIAPVLTNMVRTVREDEAPTADVLDAVRVLSSLESSMTAGGTLQPNGQAWLKPAAQMERIAAEICTSGSTHRIEASHLLGNTAELAGRCLLDPTTHMGLGRPKVPETQVIGLDHSPGDPRQELRQRCQAGLTARYPEAHHRPETLSRVQGRLEHELGIIERLGFSSYFLTVAEVARMIEEMGIRVSARGSGVSSLVNHLLRISPVDPIEHELVFERFLSGTRSTLPDVDLDVESARRHEIYQRIFKRFGAERTTLMSMQNSYRIRGAVRDAGLALGLPEEEIGRIAETMWRFPASELREKLTEKPELRRLAEQLEADQSAGRRQLDLLVDLTERLDRLPRHISTHPCGIILGNSDLLDLTPVQPSGVEQLPMSQFDKHDMDPMGFLKLDVLGVRMQSTIAYALQEVRRTTGERIDLEAVDRDDEQTYELIRTTNTLGCFQIESPGQRELIGKLVPKSLTDLVVDISLFRPGPMGSGMVTPYLERRHGFEPVRYPHPSLESVLTETHGVTIYHEQVLRIFATMTRCGLAEADERRRALGTRRQEEVERRFRREATAEGYSAEVIAEVWEVLASFGSFGFCKAHGAAFAVPTFESAWLKTHHPEAFLAGLFEHDPGMYPLRLLVAEARRLKIPLLPMDVSSSTGNYQLEELPATEDDGPRWGIRMALTSLKGISRAEICRIVAAQPFTSLTDFRDRARPRRPTLRSLAAVGALDPLTAASRMSRADLLTGLETPITSPRPGLTHSSRHRAGGAAQRRQVLGQLPLPISDFEPSTSGPPGPHPPLTPPAPKDLAPKDLERIVGQELELTGIDMTAHVMEAHHETFAGYGTTYAEDLLTLRNGSSVRVAGIRVATQTPPMASGRRVVFISLDDGTGCSDIAFFDEAQEQAGELLFTTRLLLVEGTIRRTGPRAVSIQAVRAWGLPPVAQPVVTG